MALQKIGDDAASPAEVKAATSGSSDGGQQESGEQSKTKAAKGEPPDTGEKKKAAKQPAQAVSPNGEALAAAIKRMFSEGYSGQQIYAQIQKWHPSWTGAQIVRAMMAAPKPLKPLPASPKDAKPQKPTGTGVSLSSLAHIAEKGVTKAAHYTTSSARRDLRDAKKLERQVAHGVTEAKQFAKTHPGDVAAVAGTAAAIAALLGQPELAVPLEIVADIESGRDADRAVADHDYLRAVLDIASVATTSEAQFLRQDARVDEDAAKKAKTAAAREDKKLRPHERKALREQAAADEAVANLRREIAKLSSQIAAFFADLADALDPKAALRNL
jgi:hypothetical protein